MDCSDEVFENYSIMVFGPSRSRRSLNWLRMLVMERVVEVQLDFHDPDHPCPVCREALAKTFEEAFEGLIDEVESRPSLAHMYLRIRMSAEKFLTDGSYDRINQAVVAQTEWCIKGRHSSHRPLKLVL